MRELIAIILQGSFAVVAIGALVVGILGAALEDEGLKRRARDFFEDLSAAMREARGQLKVVAVDMGYSVPELSRKLNPTRPNFLSRLVEHPDIEFALLAQRLARFEEDDVATVVAVARHRRRMAKMRLEQAQQKESA